MTDRVRVERLDHVTVNVTDVDRARAFYGGTLGLVETPRPASFTFGGAVRWDRTKIPGVDRFFTEDPDGNLIEVQGPEGP